MSDTPLGVARFFYSKQAPARAVKLAEIACSDIRPAEIVDIQNMPLLGTAQGPQPYTVWSGSLTGTSASAPGLGASIRCSGATTYYVKNQFFELTGTFDSAGAPLYYRHPLATPSLAAYRLLALDGQEVSFSTKVVSGSLYHTADGQAYWLEYFLNGMVRRDLLTYQPALQQVASAPGAGQYRFSSGGKIEVSATSLYQLRFWRDNGYQVIPPYNVPLNDPWYLRVRFTPTPFIAREWARQPFAPGVPYLQATWIPGKVLAVDVIEFERPRAYFDGKTFPDVLVYDAQFNLKYALDGSPPGVPQDKGYLYPWIRSQFLAFDSTHARVQVGVRLDPADKCFAFYCYNEQDVVFTDLDLNPYSHPALKNKIVQFYYADRSGGAPLSPPNGDFESGVLAPWGASVPGTGSVTITTSGRTGRYGLTQGPNNQPECAYQDLYGFTEGVTYNFSAWVRASADNTPVVLAIHDTTGNNWQIRTATVGTNWTFLLLPYTVNATGGMRIHLYQNPCPYTTFWDDVSVVPA